MLVSNTISFNEGFRYIGKAQYNITSPDAGKVQELRLNTATFAPDKDSPPSVLKIARIFLNSLVDIEQIVNVQLSNNNLTIEATTTLANSIEKYLPIAPSGWMSEIVDAKNKGEAYNAHCYTLYSGYCFTWQHSKVVDDKIKNLAIFYIVNSVSVDIDKILNVGGKVAFLGQFENLKEQKDQKIQIEAHGMMTLDVIKATMNSALNNPTLINAFQNTVQNLAWILNHEVALEDIVCTLDSCEVKPKIINTLPAISVFNDNGHFFKVSKSLKYRASYEYSAFDDFLQTSYDTKEQAAQERISQASDNMYTSYVQISSNEDGGIRYQIVTHEDNIDPSRPLKDLNTQDVELPNSNKYLTTSGPYLPIDYQIQVLHPSQEYPTRLLGCEALLSGILQTQELKPEIFNRDQLLFKYDSYAQYDALAVLLKNLVNTQGLGIKTDRELYLIIQQYFFNTINLCKKLRSCADFLLQPLPDLILNKPDYIFSKPIIWPVLNKDAVITQTIHWPEGYQEGGQISDADLTNIIVGDKLFISESFGTIVPYAPSGFAALNMYDNAALAGNILAYQHLNVICRGDLYVANQIVTDYYVGFTECENKLYALNSYWQVGSVGIPSAGELMLSNTYISFRDSLDISAQQVDLESVTIVSEEGAAQITAEQELTLSESQIDAATVIVKLDNGCVNFYKGSSIHGTRVTMDQQDCDFVYKGQNIHADELLEIFAKNITTHRLWEEDSNFKFKIIDAKITL